MPHEEIVEDKNNRLRRRVIFGKEDGVVENDSEDEEDDSGLDEGECEDEVEGEDESEDESSDNEDQEPSNKRIRQV